MTMREILFRGKIKVSGAWVEGNLNTVKWWFDGSPITVIIPTDAYLDPRSGAGTIRYVDVIPETVGQWTGLVDQNGKKIFEGDIVKTVEGPFPVVYEHGAFWLYDEMLLSNDHLDFLGSYKTEAIEIIGNIHDNPELLKGE